MNPQKPKSAKDKILEELQAIHAFLSEPQTPVSDTAAKNSETAATGETRSLFEQSDDCLDPEKMKQLTLEQVAGQSELFRASSLHSEDKRNEAPQTKMDSEIAPNNRSEKSDSKNEKELENPEISDENPFLPRHIRDRLHKGQANIMDELMQVGDSLKRDKNHFLYTSALITRKNSLEAQSLSDIQYNVDRIVDQLVAEYLPKIEAELRLRLRVRLTKARNEQPGSESQL